MNNFDKHLKKRLSEEQIEIPHSIKNQIENTLQTLPEIEIIKQPIFNRPRLAVTIVCIILITFFLLPNVSVVYAKTMEKIPFIGEIVKVITIRNYYYSDEKHQMEIKVPKIENENEKAFAPINSEIQELTDILLKQFNHEREQIENESYSSLYVDYHVVMNADTWFTLKIEIFQAAASGNTTYKYYHLNKMTGKIIQLGDIVASKDFYKIVKQEIEKQMREEMKCDNDKIYWVQDDAVIINAQHNFYWDEKGNLVIPFDEYEVAPGYMGTPEFTIDKNIFKEYVKEEFNDIIA